MYYHDVLVSCHHEIFYKMFKLFIPVVAALSFCYAAHAETLQLAFRSIDGSERAFNAKNLKMQVSNGNLSVTNDEESQIFSLDKLDRMYFKGGESTLVGEFEFNKAEELNVYSINGEFKGSYISIKEAEKNLDSGVYIFRSEGKSIKIIVK